MKIRMILALGLLTSVSFAAQQHIDFGSGAVNDGDTAPVAFHKIEDNFTENYGSIDLLTTDLASLTSLVATKQDSDADLSTIAGLSPSNDDVLQRKAGGWTNRTLAQLKSDLSLSAADFGLGNVDNTSDATKNAAVATLTNKSISGGQITSAVANATSAVSAGTAAALSADGTDCSIGDASRGIDTSGNATGCFTPAASGAPTDATYITQTANGSLSNEQAMGALATGIVKNTTTTGVQSIAAQGTDYYAPGGTDVAVADGGTGASTATGARTNLDVQQHDTDLDAWAGKTAPSGAAVGTTDSQTLTNKTLTSPAITTPTGLVKGDVGLGNVDNTSNATERAATATLTNKTLNSPVINTPTGIVKGDVGLGNVDNTSNATERAATATLTNKTISGAANTITNVSLTTGITGVLPVANGGAAAIDVQQFTSSGTWTKPSNATIVRVVVIGAGGGGGGGARVASGTACSGGAGGGGGGRTEAWFSASDLTGTVAITVGIGGPGGAGATSDGAVGSDGTKDASPTSNFGAYLYAFGGGGGDGGEISGGSGGGGGGASGAIGNNATSATGGAGGTVGGGTGGSGGVGGSASSNVGGGGGGGGTNGAIGANAGGSIGGGGGGVPGSGITTGAAGFGSTGISRVMNYTDPTVATPGYFGGPGGLGGSSTTPTSPQSGGTALRGGGGGGGACGLGVNGAAGGAGGNGYVRVTTFP